MTHEPANGVSNREIRDSISVPWGSRRNARGRPCVHGASCPSDPARITKSIREPPPSSIHGTLTAFAFLAGSCDGPQVEIRAEAHRPQSPNSEPPTGTYCLDLFAIHPAEYFSRIRLLVNAQSPFQRTLIQVNSNAEKGGIVEAQLRFNDPIGPRIPRSRIRVTQVEPGCPARQCNYESWVAVLCSERGIQRSYQGQIGRNR